MSALAATLATEQLARLWSGAAMPEAALSRIVLTGPAAAVPSSFAVAPLLQASLGAAALASTEVGAARGAKAARLSVDATDAVLESAAYFTLDGVRPPLWDKISGLYRCGEQIAKPGHVRIHANFAHHRDGALALLGLPPGDATERGAVEQALRAWRAEDFEQQAAERGLVVAAIRSAAEWRAHSHGEAVASLPLVDMQRLGEAPVLAWPAGATSARPLQGLRVLDLTRILAGPVAGRTLAAYGADVMLVNSPKLPNIESIADTSRGKLSVHLDLTRAADREALRGLVRDCDVFLQGYRPGGLMALGFGADELAKLKPGIVCLSLSAYGHLGPWADRRGFDSLVQSATGINIAEAEGFGEAVPRALPLQALDYGAGYLLAFGAAAALLRQRSQGGSWHVRVALAGLSHWLQGLPRLPEGPRAAKPGFEGVLEESDSGFGRLAAVRHAVLFDGERARWLRPSMRPGTHEPRWPERGAG